MKRIFLMVVLLLPLSSTAQVEHNFEMGPENTDCGSLDSLSLPEQEMPAPILAATFRYREELRISRYTAPRKLVYASCDGKDGYLLAWQDDSLIHVYEKVPLAAWEAILTAGDPRESYRTVTDTLTRYTQKKAH